MARAVGGRASTATPGTAGALAGSGRCVAQGLLVAFVALLALLPEAQAQTTIKMVGNGASSTSYSYLGTNSSASYRELAQRFTTGSNSNGYTLSTASIWFSSLPASADVANFVAAIYTNSSNRPGTLKYTLTNPSSNFATNGKKDFSAPSNSTLDPSTKYWLVLMNDNATDGQNANVASTDVGKDSDSLAGWSIENQRYQRSSMSGSWTSWPTELQISISGYANTTTNTDATGKPAITGTAEVGQTLTASKGTIADAEGTTKADAGDTGYAYTYQWVRVDGSTETAISGETGTTYTPVADDVGKTIKMQASFKDDEDNAEGPLTSDATAAVVACDALWCATMTVGTSSVYGLSGYSIDNPAIGTLTPRRFTYDGATVRVNTLAFDDGYDELNLSFFGNLGGSDYTLQLGGLSFTLGDPGSIGFFDISTDDIDWTDGETVTVKLFEGSGGVTLSDDATLTSLVLYAVSRELDEEIVTLTPAFDVSTTEYTAVVGNRFDGASIRNIVRGDSGASVVVTDGSGSHILGSTEDSVEDLGLAIGENTITVTVTAADGTTETYTLVVTRTPPPPLPIDCETSDIWCATLAVAALSNNRFGYSGAQGSLSPLDFAHDGTQYTLTTLFINTASGVETPLLISFHPEGETVFNTDDFFLYVDGTAFAFSDATFTSGHFEWANSGLLWGQADTVEVRLVDESAATGQPTISGTALVGETLTADTSGIADADGLTSVSYSYQWIRVLDTVETEISGATSSTYMLVADDVGKTIRVKVTFTDDADNPETAISDAFPSSGTVLADTTAPAVDTATVLSVGDRISIVFDENLDATASGMVTKNAFTITADGASITIGQYQVITTNTIALRNLSPVIGPGQTVIVSYADPTAGDAAALKDAAGNEIASFSETAINNSTAALSTDATLSGLALKNAADDSSITLTPSTFVSTTKSYTADVANDVDQITVEPTSDHNATFAYLNASDTALVDADSVEDGFQVDLLEGENTVKVKVTAEDDTTTDTYTVVVTRLRRVTTTPAAPAEIEVPNDWSLIPAGLVAGDKFRLLFLSSTKTDGESYDIADYNTFIQGLAAAGHTDIRTYSPGFRALGCTADSDARDNTATTGTGEVIHWLNGNKAADNYADFYNGNWDTRPNDLVEVHRIRSPAPTAPNTSNSSNYPLTGCDDDGTEVIEWRALHYALGESQVPGRPSQLRRRQRHATLTSNSTTRPKLNTRPMYGLSQVFEVAAAGNTSASGKPAITGTAQVGQTLTASHHSKVSLTGTIADAEALGPIRPRTLGDTAYASIASRHLPVGAPPSRWTAPRCRRTRRRRFRVRRRHHLHAGCGGRGKTTQGAGELLQRELGRRGQRQGRVRRQRPQYLQQFQLSSHRLRRRRHRGCRRGHFLRAWRVAGAGRPSQLRRRQRRPPHQQLRHGQSQLPPDVRPLAGLRGGGRRQHLGLGQTGNHGDGAGRPDTDRVKGHDRGRRGHDQGGRRRYGVCLHLPVGAGGRQHGDGDSE